MRETMTTDGSSRDERPSLAKAYDWRAGQTWLVFLGLAAGYAGASLVAAFTPLPYSLAWWSVAMAVFITARPYRRLSKWLPPTDLSA